nr:MAG TPA: transmembrane protein [Caudoviricetes sp.]
MKWLAILLTVVFTIAKLLGFITWSWWLVFTPALAYYAVIFLIWMVTMIILIIKS